MEPTQAIRAEEPHDERSTDTSRITTDELYQALSNSRRRRVIRALEDGPRDLGPICRAIAAAENDIPVEAVDGQQRKRVYISLYQVHLDKLEDWGIVEWDGVVAPGPAYQTAVDAMDAVAEADEELTLRERVAARIREVVA